LCFMVRYSSRRDTLDSSPVLNCSITNTGY
jgi:hypothetical protein